MTIIVIKKGNIHRILCKNGTNESNREEVYLPYVITYEAKHNMILQNMPHAPKHCQLKVKQKHLQEKLSALSVFAQLWI